MALQEGELEPIANLYYLVDRYRREAKIMMGPFPSVAAAQAAQVACPNFMSATIVQAASDGHV